MFKDKYKEAHNSVVPDEELLSKIIAAADCELKKKNGIIKKFSFYPYLYAAAAVLMITASITGYNALKPQTTKTNTVISENTEMKNVQKSEEVQTIKKEAEADNKISVDEEVKENQNNEALKTNKKEKNEAVTFGKNQSYILNDSVEEEKIPVTVVWNVNTAPQNNTVMQRSISLASEEIRKSESIYEEMTKDEYEEYIGIKAETAEIPTDMILYPSENFQIEKDSQTGEVLNDENTYYFEASYDRFIMISTTTKKEECESYLNDKSMHKSVIDNCDIVVTQNEGIYNAYFIKNDTGIKITAGKIEEKELQNTIKSLLN